MSSCTIGYYPLIDITSQNIQATYLEILNDPVYAQGMDQTIVPINCSIYQDNKPWVPNPDFISEDAMNYNSNLYGTKRSKFASKLSTMESSKPVEAKEAAEPTSTQTNAESIESEVAPTTGQGLKLAGTGISLAGYGINYAGYGKSKTYSVYHGKIPEITAPKSGIMAASINDVQDVNQHIMQQNDNMLNPIQTKKNKNKIKRPMSNVTYKKHPKPGSGLRKKLIHKMKKNKMSSESKMSTSDKKTYVKQLLQRLNPGTK